MLIITIAALSIYAIIVTGACIWLKTDNNRLSNQALNAAARVEALASNNALLVGALSTIQEQIKSTSAVRRPQ